MRSVLWSIVVLLGSCMLQPALLTTHAGNRRRRLHERATHEDDWLKSFHRYEVVIPTRTNEQGHHHPSGSHFLSKRSAGGDANGARKNDRILFYSIVAFGRTFRLTLSPHVEFVAPGLRLHHLDGNSTWLGEEAADSAHCYHQGSVKDDLNSVAVVSVCDQLVGTIYAFNQHYMIDVHPNHTARAPNDSTPLHHIMYQLKDPHHYFTDTPEQTEDRVDYKHGRRKENDTISSENQNRNRPTNAGVFNQTRHRGRHKRSLSLERYLEIMVVVDKEMSKYHGSDLHRYVLTLMSIVASIYKDPTIGNAINVVVVKIVVLEGEQTGPRISSNAASTLRNFCSWQHENNDPDDSSPFHHDTAILLTREDICRSSRKCDTLGLAELGTMCDSKRTCSIIEDNGLSAAFTIAHELGHVFSLPHDDDKLKCKEFKDQKLGLFHVMSPTLDYSTNPWSWSVCSKNLMIDYLDSGHGDCLLDEPTALQYNPKLKMPLKTQTQPGEVYDKDVQCDQVFGKGSIICPFMPVCKRLWCTSPGKSENSGCRTQHMPWSDGTKCGTGKWCQRGECILRREYVPVAGGWSKWSLYGECTRTCGGGIKQAERFCSNPMPKHGGKYCIGQRVKYKSCNTKDCVDSQMSFRELQCSKFDGKHFNINGLHPNVRWVPKYAGIALKDRCKMFCRVASSSAYYMLSDHVVDGTKCGPYTSDICVQSKCQKAGCDNRLGSSKKRDRCGICGGNGRTCVRITRTFNESYHVNKQIKFGYNSVGRIPRGATDIDIRQHGYNNLTKDDNYLALRDSKGQYILNGNFVVSMFKKELKIKGSILEYTGSDNIVERINSTQTLHDDVELLVLSVGDLHPPDISYSYVISESPTSPNAATVSYTWSRRKGAWSRCDRACQGFKRRKIVCMESGSSKIVPDENCKHEKKPKAVIRRCHTKCTVRWQIQGQSKCSVECGIGMMTRKVRCLKVKRDRPRYVKDRHCAHLRKKPRSSVRCQGLCLRSRWVYSRWSKCTKNCGGGVQYRDAVCMNMRNETIADQQCRGTKETSRRCNKAPCPLWQHGDWTQCSVTCGNGVRVREVVCKRGDNTVHKRQCSRQSQPKKKARCNLAPCPVWFTGSWSRCSATCGLAIKKRVALCRAGSSGPVLSNDKCNFAKQPRDQMKCYNLPPCAYKVITTTAMPTTTLSSRQLNWRTGSWTTCSVSCGAGTSQRYVSCVDQDGRLADNSECKRMSKPESMKPCMERPCGTWRTGDWSGCSVTCGEGMETRLVACITLEHLEGQITSPTQCDMAIKPSVERLCNLHSCPSVDSVASISSNDVTGTAHWRIGYYGRCSVSCGGGKKRRRVMCQDENGPTDSCDLSTRPDEYADCNTEACPTWSFGNWGPCSVTCGIGRHERVVVCRRENGDLLSEGRCDSSTKPSPAGSCRQAACVGGARWSRGSWSQYNDLRSRALSKRSAVQVVVEQADKGCSTSCGPGHKTRSIRCVDSQGNKVDESQCAKKKRHRRPRGVKRCRQASCPHWKVNKWTKCSVSCGAGVSHRKVKCVVGKNRLIDIKLCENETRPDDIKFCLVSECARFQWHVSKWSECSQSCGFGKMSRNASCIDTSARGKEVNASECGTDARPKTDMKCQLAPCSAQWMASNWGKCSSSCGVGKQTRQVTCRATSREGWILDGLIVDHCNDTDRPPTMQWCNLGDCESYFRWHTDDWQNCSKDCGHGVARRNVTCYNIHANRRSHQRHCRGSYKPATTKPCYLKPCYVSSCGELKEQMSVMTDGEYSLYIQGTFLEVYCHHMRSQPVEYITLPAGEKENYSEVYDKRLRQPDTCPGNGTRVNASSCGNCLAKPYRRAGLTSYSKIRINITSLRVIVSDLEFSSTVAGTHRVPFASAGDCYSTNNCPQGVFRVNLAGTKLKVSASSSWKSTGYTSTQHIAVSIDRQVVEGRCGGYCGHCTPDSATGLQLQLVH